ncbi:STAS-like domain-containing protein [Photobacterium sp. SP02]|uniref:STAS-like domain-containing protein n=1 Tax=Photobacterium sp. SP02 TaxID=3032280 RepID=UPI0031451F33
MITIIVKEIVGSNAISMNSGNKLREKIVKNWDADSKIRIDFSGVDVFASPFFNASIGALLKDKKIEDLQNKLEFHSISNHGRKLLNLVISNALKFYSDKDGKTNSSLTEIKKEL